MSVYGSLETGSGERSPLLDPAEHSYEKLSQAAHDQTHRPRSWVQIDTEGHIECMHNAMPARHHLVERLGCNVRDLRLVDPVVSSSPTACAIFIRSKSIILNIESIRMIIERNKATILACPQYSTPLNIMGIPDENCALARHIAAAVSGCLADAANRNLPFELKVVEAALTVATSTWDREAADLTARCQQALESLTKLTARTDLNPTRRCKSDVAKLSERLKKGLKALESLLDERDVFAIPTRRETLAVAHKPPKKPDEKLAPVAEDDEVEAPASAKDYPLWTKRRSRVLSLGLAVSAFEHVHDDEDELLSAQEMLECFEIQVEMMLSHVSALGERITRWEDQIQLELDIRRNELVLWDLRATVATLALAFISAVGSVFGQNLKNGLEDSHAAFLISTVGSTIIAVVLGLALLHIIASDKQVIAV